jgi:hypothetical protein
MIVPPPSAIPGAVTIGSLPDALIPLVFLLPLLPLLAVIVAVWRDGRRNAPQADTSVMTPTVTATMLHAPEPSPRPRVAALG